MRCSQASLLASIPDKFRDSILDALSPDEALALLHDWPFWARPNQLPPSGSWRIWLLLAGRGFGKTRAGAELIRSRVAARRARRLALVAPTAADARDIMVEGESGILAISPHWDRPRYEPSRRRLIWHNGATATFYSADEPERLRGPQHDTAWCDELTSWRYPEAWDMLMFGLRLGDDPRVVVTTTPRPMPLLRALVKDPVVAVTRGTTYQNRANLAPDFLDQIVRKYEGTRLGRQEIEAEILDDLPGGLWSRGLIEAARVRSAPPWPELWSRLILRSVPERWQMRPVSLSPAGTSQGAGWVLADLSGHYRPIEWAKAAIAAYRAHRADRIVAEINNGGEMVETTIRMIDPDVPFTSVHASRGKVPRAEPVAALYEQGKVHHLGAFPQLEDQMCSLTRRGRDGNGPRPSPDRVDALVWALTDLLVTPLSGQGIYEAYRQLSDLNSDCNRPKLCS